MHLFLYQANRHAAAANSYSYGNRSRYKQGTIRGDFDLELLKKGIKGRYKILPHGEHEFQQVLKQIDLQEELYGHVVQIEEARNAIWFKLNYDQVGKNVTKYIGGWRDLDPQAISSVVMEYKSYKSQLADVRAHLSRTRYSSSQLKSFIDGIKAKPIVCLDGVQEKMQDAIIAIGDAYTALTLEEAHLLNKMEACHQAVRDYLKERKL
jgi:hypothetical protein